MKRLLLFLALAGCPLATSSCSLFKPKKQDPPETTAPTNAPKLVGRIASIPADKRFVLIESFGKWNIRKDTILTTRGQDNRSANLLVTGESLGQFAAADLQSGSLEIGDAVYSRHTPSPTQEPDTSPNPPEIPKSELPKPAENQ